MKKRTDIMRSDKGRILFVEDEKFLLNMYHDYFERNGYDFLTTGDIKEALIVTEFEQPDAVLLDIIIPKPENTVAEQGYEFLEAVKNNPKTKDIPIIVFTNLDTEQDRKKCQRMGAAAYIFKNAVAPNQVLETVAKIIKLHRQKK
jgi:CheY-like chemotaxis protein